jgi:hypothetical protein
MNFALSPETAVTVGSASVWATPCRSKACKLALKLWFPFTQFRIPWVALMAPLTANGLSTVKLPFGPLPLKLTPSCLMISRRISATVTCKLTWSAPRIVKALITLPRALLEDLPADPPPPPGAPPEPFEMEIEAPGAPEAGVSLTKPSAMSSAFWASSADATDPVRMIVFSTVRT